MWKRFMQNEDDMQELSSHEIKGTVERVSILMNFKIMAMEQS